jgi:2-oxo-3-(phosphooxy)propyl 3-oxoalkanoate synthase
MSGTTMLGTDPAGRAARLTAAVPREYVHRAAVAEVLLTGWRPRRDGFAVTAQWPRGHSFFLPQPGPRYDPLIVAETVRQVGLLLAHAEFGVPLGHQFLIRELGFTADPEALRLGPAPAELDLAVTCSDIGRNGRHLKGMRYRVDIRRDERWTAGGTAWFACTSAAVYQRLRKESRESAARPVLTEPVRPELVGRVSARDVVLSPADDEDRPAVGAVRRWRLRVDQAHPVLFDHPVDHVPGMLLLEAARQAGQAICAPRRVIPAARHSSFQKYVEPDQPCWIETGPTVARATGDLRMTIIARQHGEAVFTAGLTARAL